MTELGATTTAPVGADPTFDVTVVTTYSPGGYIAYLETVTDDVPVAPGPVRPGLLPLTTRYNIGGTEKAPVPKKFLNVAGEPVPITFQG